MSLRNVKLFFAFLLIYLILTQVYPRFKNQHMSGKSVENEHQKFPFFNPGDPEKRGSCSWNSNSNDKNRGTLKKRWPNVIGLGFAKVRIFSVLIFTPKLSSAPRIPSDSVNVTTITYCPYVFLDDYFSAERVP